MNASNISVDRFIFSIFVKKMAFIYDKHIESLRLFIDEQRSLGVTDKEINSRLESDLKNNTGIYAELDALLSGGMVEVMNKSFQLSSNQYDNLSTKVRWMLDPLAEHCDSCLYQASRGVLTIDQFPIPGFQETHGETNCEEYCKCTLVPVLEGDNND